MISESQEQFGEYRRRALTAAVLAHFTNDGNTILFSVLIAYYLTIHLSLAFLGAAAALSNLVSGLVAERIGFRADRSGRRGRMMAMGICLLGGACLIFSLSFSIPGYAPAVILPGATMLGVGLAFYHPLGGSIIAFAVKGKALSRHMGINGSFGSAGRALFPALIVILIPLLGAPVGLLALGVAFSAIGVAIYWLSRSFDKFMVSERRRQPASRTSLKPYRRFVFALTAIFMVNGIFSSGITTYITAYFGEVYGSISTGGLVNTLVLLTPIFGQPIQGYLADRIGGRRTLQINVIGSALVFALFLYSHDVVLQIVSLAALAFFVYTGFPVIIAYATLMTPRESITRINAIVWGFGSTIGNALGSSLGGTVGQDYGFHTAFTVSWIFGLAAIAMLPVVPSRIAASAMSAPRTVPDSPPSMDSPRRAHTCPS